MAQKKLIGCRINVGDDVVWCNEFGTIKGNFRGFMSDNQKAVIVANGSQMCAPTCELFYGDSSVHLGRMQSGDILKGGYIATKTDAKGYNSYDEQLLAAVKRGDYCAVDELLNKRCVYFKLMIGDLKIED